jgi:hypothetical protein
MIINELQPFFLTNDKLLTIPKYELVNVESKRKTASPQTKEKEKYKDKLSFFKPIENDKLFWIFYIIKFGEMEYQLFKNKNIIFEKKYKIDFITKIRDNKTIIKQHKFCTISALENNLANDPKLTLASFLYLCIFEEINVVIIKNKTYFKLFTTDSPTLYLIKEMNSAYSFCEYTIQQFQQNIEAKYYEISNIIKPINAITHYKVDELKDICQKLDIDIHDKKTKKELYDNIISCF